MKLCKDTGEQIEITTYADDSMGIARFVCADCSKTYAEPRNAES